LQIIRKTKAGSAMTLEQFGQKILVDRDLTAIERCEFLVVIVHDNYVVTEIGEAGAGHQSHVS
jgi:hypothetical protein